MEWVMGQTVTQATFGPTSGGRRPVVLLLTSNGWGMGHLSRQLALATALGDRAEPVFLSLSGAVHLVAAQGFRAEYCPSPSRGWLEPGPWNAYLAERVVALARETQARALVFDGVFPYRGLLEARRHLPDVAFVWSRRGMWAVGRGEESLKTGWAFDLILEPGDLGAAADPGLTVGRSDALRIPPVTLVDVVTQPDRAEARAALGIATDAQLLLVSLSAGTGEPGALLRSVVDGVLASSSWHLAVITNPLAAPADTTLDDPRVHRLTDVYPLVRYLRAFDAGVVSAGYNAAHELPLSGVPTLLIANHASAWDDQVSRARGIAERGLALWTTDDEPETAGRLAADLVADGPHRRLLDALRSLDAAERGGALQVADLVARAANGHGRYGEALRPLRRRLGDQARWAVQRIRLRARGVVVASRWLAWRILRGEIRPVSPRPRVDVVEERAGTEGEEPPANRDRPDVVLFTERLSRDVIAGAGPIEQVLATSSTAYREARRQTVRRFFDAGAWRILERGQGQLDGSDR